MIKRFALAAVLAVGGLGMAEPAMAMPGGLDGAVFAPADGAQIEQARVVCNRFRCFRVRPAPRRRFYRRRFYRY